MIDINIALCDIYIQKKTQQTETKVQKKKYLHRCFYVFVSNFVVFLCVSVLEFNDAWIYSRYCIGTPLLMLFLM